jgi:hypothetical protein
MIVEDLESVVWCREKYNFGKTRETRHTPEDQRPETLSCGKDCIRAGLFQLVWVARSQSIQLWMEESTLSLKRTQKQIQERTQLLHLFCHFETVPKLGKA